MKYVLALAVAALLLVPMVSRANDQDVSPFTMGQSRMTPSGPETNGFALSLQANSSYYAGQPVMVTLEVRNITGITQHLLLGARDSSYQFSVINTSTGRSAARRPSRSQLDSLGGPSSGRPIPPGHSKFVTIDLADLYVLGPGQYRVTATEARVVGQHRLFRIGPSNAATFEVLP